MGNLRDQLPLFSLLIHTHTAVVSECPSFVLTTDSAIPRKEDNMLKGNEDYFYYTMSGLKPWKNVQVSKMNCRESFCIKIIPEKKELYLHKVGDLY